MTVTPSIVSPVSNRPPAGILSVLAASLILIAGLCVLLLPQWRENPDLSHGFFAPLVFFLLISECRRQGTQRWLPASPWSVAAQAGTLFTGIVLFALAGLFAASLAWNHALVLLPARRFCVRFPARRPLHFRGRASPACALQLDQLHRHPPVGARNPPAQWHLHPPDLRAPRLGHE